MLWQEVRKLATPQYCQKLAGKRKREDEGQNNIQTREDNTTIAKLQS